MISFYYDSVALDGPRGETTPTYLSQLFVSHAVQGKSFETDDAPCSVLELKPIRAHKIGEACGPQATHFTIKTGRECISLTGMLKP